MILMIRFTEKQLQKTDLYDEQYLKRGAARLNFKRAAPF
jgi:hypothetical protein